MSRWRRTRPAHEPIPLTLKSGEQIELMHAAASAAWRVLHIAISAIKPGITTSVISDAAVQEMERLGADGLFRGYCQLRAPPFPSDICVSVNDEAVHGIPGARVLGAGDAVSVDVGLRLNGWCADIARTVVVQAIERDVPPAVKTRIRSIEYVIASAQKSLRAGIALMRPGVQWSTVARAMERVAAEADCGVMVDFVGHGIGRQLHEPPKAPAAWSGYVGDDFTLEAGMVLAIEPMLTRRLDADGLPISFAGQPVPDENAKAVVTPILIDADGWTARSRDGSIVVHEERVIAVTAEGARVLGDGVEIEGCGDRGNGLL